MDHLIDQFEIYLDSSFCDFYSEWTSKKYKKYSDCPSYGELKTLIDSVNHLRKFEGWENISIKEMLELRE